MWWCFKTQKEEKKQRETTKDLPPSSFTIHEESLPWILPMNERTFDHEKVKIFEEFNVQALTCNQLALTLKTLDFSKTKKEFCEMVINKITDIENYKVISENQIFWDKKDMESMFKENIVKRRNVNQLQNPSKESK